MTSDVHALKKKKKSLNSTHSKPTKLVFQSNKSVMENDGYPTVT